MRVPAGDHINELRRPGVVPTLLEIRIDRTVFSGTDFSPDIDPWVFYYKDDFWTDPIACPPIEEPSRRYPSVGYKTMIFPINEQAERFAFQIRKINSINLIEIHNVTMIMKPEKGVGG